MSSPKKKRDIVRLRTFADDVERAKNEGGISDAVAASALPTASTAPSEGSGVFLKVKKRSLELKDESQTSTPLDTDGVTFDEETATKVADKAYEEHKSIVADATAKANTDPMHPAAISAPVNTVPHVQIPKVQPVTKKPLVLEADETINQIDAPVASVLETKEAIHDVSQGDMGGGQFVSDKKRERFKLIPAIGEAVTDWFGETKEQIDEARREKHTVAKTETRVETIKAAAQQKTFAPSEDFDAVAERLKQTKKVQTESTPVIVKPKTTQTARWTHTISENGDEIKSETEPETIPEVQPASDEVVSQNTESAILERTPLTAPVTVEPLVKNEAPVLDTSVLAETISSPAPTAPVQPSRPSSPVLKNTPTPVSAKREFLPSPILAIIVVVIAIVSGIGTSVYFFWQPGETAVVSEPTTNPLFTAQLQTNVTFSDSHSETMNTLLSAVNSNPSTLYMYFTRASDQSLVSPVDIMTFLAPQAPGSFVRSVTNLSFGAQDNRPFIVLRVNNFDNAFPGILAWERTMSADLVPLFGPIVTESFDPQARTDSQTREAFFRDIITNNLSSRLLADEEGEDRIVYTFLDKQTILITTDRLQLSNIIPLIR